MAVGIRDRMILDAVKRLSIVDYLGKRGYRWTKNTDKNAFFLSPFRNESMPSFVVNKYKNTWFDFGDNSHGDIVALVCRLENCDFNTAMDRLSDKTYIPLKTEVRIGQKRKSIEVLDVFPLKDKKLIDYMTIDRHLDFDLVNKYCSEAVYSFPNGRSPQSRYNAVAFKNDFGGYELRNAVMKISSDPKGYTSFEGREPANIFEGFINFLSCLQQLKQDHFANTTYVLNGAGIINMLAPMLKSDVNCFTDNDNAGSEVINVLLSHGIKVNDCRYMYEFFNDCNDKLKVIK